MRAKGFLTRALATAIALLVSLATPVLAQEQQQDQDRLQTEQRLLKQDPSKTQERDHDRLRVHKESKEVKEQTRERDREQVRIERPERLGAERGEHHRGGR